MKTIAETPFYTLNVDSAKNRIYFKALGNWSKKEDVGSSVNDMKAAASACAPHFTCHADLSGVKVLIITDVAQQIQEELAKAGVSKVASIWSEQILSKLQVERTAQKAGSGYSERRRLFTDPVLGEKWLDGEDV